MKKMDNKTANKPVSTFEFFMLVVIALGFLCIQFYMLTRMMMSFDQSGYYMVSDTYYYLLKPSGYDDDLWYKYDSTDNCWNPIKEDDLPYQLGMKINPGIGGSVKDKYDYFYSQTWEENSPFSDFCNSEYYAEYVKAQEDKDKSA